MTVHRLLTYLLRNFPLLYTKYQKSYAQYGEDVVLNVFFAGQANHRGFYVDIGAHHPIRYSNTYFFYRRGWRGINVEPTPGIKRTFDLRRSRDITLPVGVSAGGGTLTFYRFDDPALNSFSKALSESRHGQQQYRIIGTTEVPTLPLSQILEQHLPTGQVIDFLTIDVEGEDLNVLRSNDWTRFRPRFVLIEDDAFRVDRANDSAVYRLLSGLEYGLVGKTLKTLIFQTTRP